MLLVTDAWFDVLTAAPGVDRPAALLMAGCAELPVAVLCAAVAWQGLLALAPCQVRWEPRELGAGNR